LKTPVPLVCPSASKRLQGMLFQKQALLYRV
jgi:hypothetical protein